MTNQAISPNFGLKWFARPTGKCDKNFYEKKVMLLVNWFKFKEKIYDREYYEYLVEMHKLVTRKGKDGKMQEKKSEVPIPERTALFWQHLRHEAAKNPNFKIEEYVFDGKDTVYSVQACDQPIEVYMVDLQQKNTTYKLKLWPQRKFTLNFSREDPLKDEEADRSYKFLKVVLTQKVRYSPEVNERVRMEFAKNFVYERNSILRVPESFHDPNRFDHSLEIAPRIESWIGIYIGIKELYDGDPVANFGIVDKLFYNAPKMSLLDYILLIVGNENEEDDETRNSEKRRLKYENLRIDPWAARKINQYLEKLKLKSTEVWDETLGRMVERHFIFTELTSVNSHEAMILIKGRRGEPSYQVPIFEIYRNNNKLIEFPYLPLVKAKSGKKEYHVPMEHLEVHEKPQPYRNWIDKAMQERVIKAATRKPNEYKRETIDMLKALKLTSEDLNFIETFGLSTELIMTKCVGKVLNEPNLVNKENKKIPMTPIIRGFQEKLLNIVPDKEICFALFILRDYEKPKPCLVDDEPFDFYERLVKGCRFRGMPIGEHEERRKRSILYDGAKYGYYGDVTLTNGACCFQVAANDALTLFNRLPDRNRKVLVFIVVSGPHKDQDAYGYIKHHCDVNLGVVSQYVRAETAKQTGSKIYNSIALKINAKLGGVNQELNFSENAEMSLAEKEERKKLPLKMYVGIDVTHPTTGSGIDFSIAAVVASVNASGTKYQNMIVTQEECVPGERPGAHGRERTDILEGKFVQLLRIFAENNDNRIPDHIIVYRDGVSDSEMLRVSHTELRSLNNEVNKFLDERGKSELAPKYTFIVIQKRHKTRLIREIDEKRPKDEKEANQWEEDMKESDNSGYLNPSSGTIVDKTIVSKYKFDFYLTSHHGALGTSRPGHYTVMFDNSGLTQDLAYKMTYELVFLSARCRKPISLPVPVMYAHLSCEKAKEIYKGFKVYKEQLPRKPSRRDIEEYLQTNVNYPGMSFA